MKVTVDPCLTPIFEKYREHVQGELQLIKVALQSQLFTEVSRIAHKLRGTAAGYGLDFVSQGAQLLEGYAQKKGLAEIHKLVSDLESKLLDLEVD